MIQKNKQKYINFCQKEDIPIFLKDWWLDNVCGKNNWDVVLVENGEEIISVLPYYSQEKFCFKAITMPELTQVMGPWIKYPENQKYTNKLSYEKKIFNKLITNLPKFDKFSQNFHHSITNWIPFYWKGFKQTTLYTYIIYDLSNLDSVFNNFKENVRRSIRKAKKNKIEIITSNDIENFYELNKMTFIRQNKTIPYSFDFVNRIDRICKEKNCRKIFFAIDQKKRIHAAIYIVWDKNSAYYLMGGSNPKLRNSGANSLTMWAAIQFISTINKSFNFEGSMIEPVEKFFRSFGSIHVPYFNISKTNSKLLKIRNFLKY